MRAVGEDSIRESVFEGMQQSAERAGMVGRSEVAGVPSAESTRNQSPIDVVPQTIGSSVREENAESLNQGVEPVPSDTPKEDFRPSGVMFESHSGPPSSGSGARVKEEVGQPMERMVSQSQAGAKAMYESYKEAARDASDRLEETVGEAAKQASTMFDSLKDTSAALVERNSQLAGELREMGRGNLEALVESSRAFARGVGTLSQEVVSCSRKGFEDASGVMRRLKQVRNPADLLEIQNELAQTAFNTAVAYNAKLLSALIRVSGEIVEPIANQTKASRPTS